MRIFLNLFLVIKEGIYLFGSIDIGNIKFEMKMIFRNILSTFKVILISTDINKSDVMIQEIKNVVDNTINLQLMVLTSDLALVSICDP